VRTWASKHLTIITATKAINFRSTVSPASLSPANSSKLSTDAKLLYGLLLDRMGLSAKNGWYDDQGRVYIYYTLDEIQADLGCGHEKAVKLLAELDTGKGFGLIERVKRGQGCPARVYVKRFTTGEKPPQPSQPQDIPRLPIFGSADFGKSDAIYIESN